MKHTSLCLLLSCSALVASCSHFRASQERQITLAELRDKVAGGWAGQMIGVAYGWPTEFRHNDRLVPEDEMPTWRPDMVSEALNQDDLYVDMTFAQVLDDKGLDATSEDFGCR